MGLGPVQPYDAQINAVKSSLKRSPNLKKISVNDIGSLLMIPQEKYVLLNKLTFYLRNIHDAHLFLTVAEGKPKLRKLRISLPMTDQDGLDDLPENLEQCFNHSLENLLTACTQNLQEISIESPYSLLEL